MIDDPGEIARIPIRTQEEFEEALNLIYRAVEEGLSLRKMEDTQEQEKNEVGEGD